MSSMTRRTLFAFAAALLLLLGRDARADDGTAKLGQALLLFEQNITWESVSGQWRAMRDKWVAAVNKSKEPADVAVGVLVLETAMGWQSVDNSWRGKRAGWVTEMEAARTNAAVGRGLLQLEAATRWSAVSPRWRQLREPWVATVKSIQ